MATTLFDTLKFSERLRGAGIPEEQAKATAEAMRDALAESRDTSPVTRDDLSILKFDLIKWMIGLFFAQIALIAGILLKIT